MSALAMIEDDRENATIERALLFYQQHLVSERQEYQSRFSGKGKSPASSDHDPKEEAYDLELRNIATIRESRKRSPRPSPTEHGTSEQVNDLARTMAQAEDSDTEPYINPFTGQWVIPDTVFTPSSSKAASSPGRPEVVNFPKSSGMINAPSAPRETGPLISDTDPEAANTQVGQSTIPKQCTASGSSSTKRKAEESTSIPDETYSSLPEPLIGTQNAGLSPTESADPFSSIHNPSGKMISKQSGRNNVQEMPMEQTTPSLEKELYENRPAIEDLRSEPLRFERHNQRSAGSFNDHKMPWNAVETPYMENKNPFRTTGSIASRQYSGQSPSSSDFTLEAQKMTASMSRSSRQSRESLQGSFKPPPSTLDCIPPTSYSSRSRDTSKSSLLINEPSSQASMTATHSVTQSSGMNSATSSTHSLPAIRLRSQPSFNTSGLGKFGSENSDQGLTNLSSPMQPQSNRRVPKQFQDENGNAEGIRTKGYQNSITREPELGKFSGENQGPKTSASREFSNQVTNKSESVRHGIRGPSDHFLPPAFSVSPTAERVPARPHHTSEVEMQPDFGSKQHPINNSSTRVSSSDHNLKQQYSHPVDSATKKIQTRTVTDRTQLPTWSTSQSKDSSGAPSKLSSRQPQESWSFSSLEDQKTLAPNQVKPNKIDTRSFFGDRNEDKVSDKQQGLSSPGSQGLTDPNQLNWDNFWASQKLGAGHQSTKEVPRDQFVVRSSGGQRSAPSNAFKPSELQFENGIPRVNQSNLSVAKTQIEEDFQLAQQIADSETLASQEEDNDLAALQKMQDEWNREEDQRDHERFVLSQSLRDDPPSYSSHNIINPATFAASSDTGNLRSEDMSKLAKSSGTQSQHVPSQQSRKLGSEGAISEIECTVCGDTESASQMVRLPCKHGYHPLCLASAFKHALAGGKLFICCDKEPAPIDLAAPHLPAQFVTNYKAKVVERSTPNPVYCAKPGCASFVPPKYLKGPMATCPECGFVTCSLCRNPEHKGVCPPDKMGAKLLNLANNKNWTQCQNCKAMIERHEGCLHMTCTCGHEFCYLCGGLWATCGGRCPRKD